MYSQWLSKQFSENPEKSKASLAKALGLEPPAISKILNGTRQIKAHEMEIIKRFFGLGATSFSSYMAYDLSDSRKLGHSDFAPYINKQPTPNNIEDMIPANAKLVQIQDSAMEPMFLKGERVVINPQDREMPGLFIMSDGYSQMMRKCEVVDECYKKSIRISAISKNFIPQILELSDVEIYGRVIGKIEPI